MPVNNITEEEVDVLSLIGYILKGWYWLLLGMLIGANILGAYVYTRPNTYTSYASIFIQSETLMNSTLSEVQLETKLSQEFIELASSKAVMDIAIGKVMDEIGVELTREDIEDTTTITNSDESRLLVFNVTTDNPQLSSALAEAMAKSTAEEVSAIMNTDEPTIVDHAEIESANGKGMAKKVLIGAFIGFACAVIVLIIRFTMNDKIMDEEDVQKYLNASVIGSISLDKSFVYYKKKKKKN